LESDRGVVDVDLVGEPYFGPTGRGGDGGGSGGGGRVLEEVFLKLEDVVGGRGDGTKVEGHFSFGFKQSAPILGDCSNVVNLLLLFK